MIKILLSLNNGKLIQNLVMIRMVYKRNYAKYNIGNIKKDLQQLWRTETTEANVNNVWNTFKRLSEMVTDKHAPLVQNGIRDRNRPWLINETQKKINERDFVAKTTGKRKCNDWVYVSSS